MALKSFRCCQTVQHNSTKNQWKTNGKWKPLESCTRCAWRGGNNVRLIRFGLSHLHFVHSFLSFHAMDDVDKKNLEYWWKTYVREENCCRSSDERIGRKKSNARQVNENSNCLDHQFIRVIAVSFWLLSQYTVFSKHFCLAPASQNEFKFERKLALPFPSRKRAPTSQLLVGTYVHGKNDSVTQTRSIWAATSVLFGPSITHNGGEARFSIYFCSDATHKFHLSLASAFKLCSMVFIFYSNASQPTPRRHRTIYMRYLSLRPPTTSEK